MKRRKILIVAYACSPVRGSEPGMGWNFVIEIAKHHDVWVLTEKEKFEHEIRRRITEEPQTCRAVKFCFIRKTRHRFLRKFWPPSYYWFYKRWHKDAYEVALALHEQVGFDIVHQLNMVGFREPGYLWKMDVPFVWGPVGGFNQFPLRFLGSVRFKGAIYYLGRNIFNFLHQRFLPRPKLAAKKAQFGLIAATTESKNSMQRLWGEDSQLLSEVGMLDLHQTMYSSKRLDGKPLRIAWSGIHTYRKALPLLLGALKMVREDVIWQLDVLGEGQLTEHWQQLSKNFGISERCTWHGWLERHVAIDIMKESHVFVITSLSDLTSTVTLEALSLGLPTICLDHCGFSDVVTDECGIKIPLTKPSEVSAHIAKAIERLWFDEGFRQSLSRGALDRAKDYSWKRKIDKLNGIYRAVLESK